MKLLGEHFAAGRLEIHEYDQRCQQAAQARFGSDIEVLFEDLPEPRPTGPETAPARSYRPPAAAGKVVLAVGAVALFVFLVVVARQVGLALLLPLVLVFFYTRRRR